MKFKSALTPEAVDKLIKSYQEERAASGYKTTPETEVEFAEADRARIYAAEVGYLAGLEFIKDAPDHDFHSDVSKIVSDALFRYHEVDWTDLLWKPRRKRLDAFAVGVQIGFAEGFGLAFQRAHEKPKSDLPPPPPSSTESVDEEPVEEPYKGDVPKPSKFDPSMYG